MLARILLGEGKGGWSFVSQLACFQLPSKNEIFPLSSSTFLQAEW